MRRSFDDGQLVAGGCSATSAARGPGPAAAQRPGPGDRHSRPAHHGVAKREQVSPLHYDSDYDLIAEIIQQSIQWVVPRGTVP